MKRITIAAAAAFAVCICWNGHARAANFLIDCDQGKTAFTLTGYDIPSNVPSLLHLPSGQVVSGTTSPNGGYGGYADPYERYVWTARFDNGATLRLNWAIRIAPNTIVLDDTRRAAFVGTQVTVTFWNERGEITAKTGNCAFTRMW